MSQEVLEKREVLTEVSIESVLLDADLFVKYRSPEKAFALLRDSLERSPRSISLREKLRDISIRQKNLNEAAKQCLALVSLYIGREEFDLAYDRLHVGLAVGDRGGEIHRFDRGARPCVLGRPDDLAAELVREGGRPPVCLGVERSSRRVETAWGHAPSRPPLAESRPGVPSWTAAGSRLVARSPMFP